MIEVLWNIAIELIETGSSIWEWLNSDFELKFFAINIFTVKPIEMIGGSFILTLIGFGLIKAFIPGA